MKTNDKNSFENSKGGIQGMQNNKSLSLDKFIPESAQKSLKRNRCHVQETNTILSSVFLTNFDL
jgi:hypothetical protein